MSGELEAFVAGAIIGRADAQHPRRRTMQRKRDPLDGLRPSRRRVALVFGQVVGNLAAAVFLGYELYTYLTVLK
jgi:hypothetical protein